MDLNKLTTIVSGYPEDLELNHVCYVATNLAEFLPNFHFTKIYVDQSEWKDWLSEICMKNNWSHTKSPLIWREYDISSDCPRYIGGATEFWEFIYEYYGVDSRLSKAELEALKLDAIFAHSVSGKLKSLKDINHCLSVTIIGAGRSVCSDLLAQLVTLKELRVSDGIILNLYDELSYFFKIKDTIADATAVAGALLSANILENISDGLKNCDILIILDHLVREELESSDEWLLRNYKTTFKLSRKIKKSAPSHMKVIFCSMGPTCFCASIIAKIATNLNKQNIVAVSAHYGLEMVHDFVKSLDVKIKNVGCPPVWGFLGISQYVDVDHMVQIHNVFRPNKRCTKAKKTSLPLGTKNRELRWFFYLSHDKKPYEILSKRKAIAFYEVGRAEDFQKCKAICDLLKLWYGDGNEDDIISLGICSDGSFGIPEGMYFSQPVYLKKLKDKSRIWSPCIEFPKPNIPSTIFQSLITTANAIKRKIDSKEPPFVLKSVESCDCLVQSDSVSLKTRSDFSPS